MKSCFKLLTRLYGLALLLVGLAPVAWAGDLSAVSDGQHLWLVEPAAVAEGEADAKPGLVIYHFAAENERGQATKISGVAGELLPRGLAAGDGRLVVVTDDRQLLSIRPAWLDLLRRWDYAPRSLGTLPEGCTLVSLAVGRRGPWALVQVQSAELLETLDGQGGDKKAAGPLDQQALNRALGLPADTPWPGDDAVEEGESASPEDEIDEPSAEPVELPTYRLLALRGGRWIDSPLPAVRGDWQSAALLIRVGDDRPTLIVRGQAAASSGVTVLERYRPVADTAADWSVAEFELPHPEGQMWSALSAKGQVIVAVETQRERDAIALDTYLLRTGQAISSGSVTMSTGGAARWTALPWQEKVGLVVSPAPAQQPSDTSDAPQLVAGLVAVGVLDGQPLRDGSGLDNADGMVLIVEQTPAAFDGNANFFIQLIVFMAAMFMMMAFYRRSVAQETVDLPEGVVLVGFSRRMMAGLADLAPGFLIASWAYGLTVGQIVFEAWPGYGPEKAFVVMQPGFLVIGITLVHSTVGEVIWGRSLGKAMLGLSVTDLSGQPVPPGRRLLRALSRGFELFAPLMALVMVINPARQRIGDILCKTVVVMDRPSEENGE